MRKSLSMCFLTACVWGALGATSAAATRPITQENIGPAPCFDTQAHVLVPNEGIR